MEKKVYRGEVLENRVFIWNERDAKEVYENGFFGKIIDNHLELALEEAMLLLKRNRLKIFKEGKELSEKEFYEYACKVDHEFPQKWIVYRDLRDRGLLVRTGFKFGAHFRVYERGVKLKKGKKKAKEHTKWVVHAVPIEYRFSFPELARAVRLAQNIRARMLWAVIDSENDVTYYEIVRKTP